MSFVLIDFDLFYAKLLGVFLGRKMALFQGKPSEGVEKQSSTGMKTHVQSWEGLVCSKNCK